MHRKCCILNCTSRRKDIPFYNFPTREKQRLKWVQSISYERLQNVKGHLSKYYVCEKHFEKKFITRPGVRSRLLSRAYPTLFSDSEISSGITKTLYKDPDDNAVTDHGYAKKNEHEDHTYFRLEPPKELKFDKIEINAENKEKENEIKENQKKAVCEALRYQSIMDYIRSWSEDMPFDSECVNEAIEKPMTREINAENMVNEKESNEENEKEADIENAEVGDYFISWSDEMSSTTDCVNKAIEKPIMRDAVVPSTPMLKVRRRRVDNNKKRQKSKKSQPQKVEKSLSPNSATPVIKSLRQLKHCHRTAKALDLSKEKSFKKVTDRMNPLATDIMWMLIGECSKKGQGTMSTEEKHNALSTLKQVRSVADSCIIFLSKHDTP